MMPASMREKALADRRLQRRARHPGCRDGIARLRHACQSDWKRPAHSWSWMLRLVRRKRLRTDSSSMSRTNWALLSRKAAEAAEALASAGQSSLTVSHSAAWLTH